MERLLYISQGKNPSAHVDNIQLMLDSGCKWVQLRIKELSNRELLPIAIKVKKICDDHEALLSINDHPEVARDIEAWGVHLGIKDSPVEKARSVIGDKIKIGGTVNTIEEVKQRVNEGVDYLGLGPLHYTNTKLLLSPILSHKGVREVMEFIRQEKISLPVVVVGGVTEPDIASLLNKGVYGIGISTLLTGSPFPEELVIKIKKNIDEALNNSR